MRLRHRDRGVFSCFACSRASAAPPFEDAQGLSLVRVAGRLLFLAEAIPLTLEDAVTAGLCDQLRISYPYGSLRHPLFSFKNVSL